MLGSAKAALWNHTLRVESNPSLDDIPFNKVFPMLCALNMCKAVCSHVGCPPFGRAACVVVQAQSLLPRYRVPRANLLIVSNREVKVQRRHGTVSSYLTCPPTLKQGQS